ncbi:hypothetical protein PL9214291151 [Planktothrix tepida PCC 9214]|uniref:Uncharacterized protein n=1 Tax=Planktothrix tepida PCC 9214 TaxID=671072 RepID=A0A1J1LGG1_9CYAN|nr:hypothetical protein PL9214291151 [Planktothrix tepida PCC 9214]
MLTSLARRTLGYKIFNLGAEQLMAYRQSNFLCSELVLMTLIMITFSNHAALTLKNHETKATRSENKESARLVYDYDITIQRRIFA